MVPVTVKTITSAEDAVLASKIARLSEPTPESLLFVTVKVAGVILSSRVISSSLEESEDFLAFLFCEILKNLRNTCVIKAPGEKLKINHKLRVSNKSKRFVYA